MFTDEQIIEKIKQKIELFPYTVVMLGSGWNKALDTVTVVHRLPYSEIFGSSAGVPGHTGELVIGTYNKQSVAFMSGRFHLYEGYSALEATAPIRAFAALGSKKLIVTSASGALNPKYQVGDFIILSDLLTLFLKDNPLKGPLFQDMSAVFDGAWRKRAIAACTELDLPFHEGVYAYMPGPHYETFADKMALRMLGADCVGMSTVPEVLQAKNCGMEVLGLSLVTNLAFVTHRHEDVVAAADRASAGMANLLSHVL